ncbi:MAG: M28 family peptidase, partial [Myxococcota bacterium]
ADWNDTAARRLLSLAPTRGKVAYRGEDIKVSAEITGTSAGFTADDVRRHVTALTSVEMDGRLTGTNGEAKATAYVADVFKQLGLEPAGDNGYFQPFEFTSGVKLGSPNVLVVEADGQTKRPAVNEAWRPLAFSKPGSIARSELVFAGYGLVDAASSGKAVYDAYEGLDVKGKWAVVLRYMPADFTSEQRQRFARFASLRFKAMEARDKGAKGIIVVTGPKAVAQNRLVPLHFDAAVTGSGITAISISDEFAQEIFARAQRDLGAAQAALDSGKPVKGFDLPGTKIGGHLTLNFQKSTGRNVVARLRVGKNPSAQTVMVGAHVDHLGRGQAGDSLARLNERGEIHPGADDNASGVAGLLEIAQYLANRKATGRLDNAARDVVFAAWSGEELGLYGSTHWVNRALEDNGKVATDLGPKVAAYFNMDMIGRLRQQAVLQGVASSGGWRKQIEQRNVVVGLPLKLTDDAYLPTDATAFYVKGVPILSAYTGVHGDYHTPRDTADKINFEGAARIARLLGLITEGVSKSEQAPDYVKVAAPTNRGNRRTNRVYLGTIPEYASPEVKGVKLSGVSNEGPAQKAGVRGGDVIVELDGRKLENIYDYVKVLDNLKIGNEIKMVVVRDGERLEFTVVPGSRD